MQSQLTVATSFWCTPVSEGSAGTHTSLRFVCVSLPVNACSSFEGHFDTCTVTRQCDPFSPYVSYEWKSHRKRRSHFFRDCGLGSGRWGGRRVELKVRQPHGTWTLSYCFISLFSSFGNFSLSAHSLPSNCKSDPSKHISEYLKWTFLDSKKSGVQIPQKPHRNDVENSLRTHINFEFPKFAANKISCILFILWSDHCWLRTVMTYCIPKWSLTQQGTERLYLFASTYWIYFPY